MASVQENGFKTIKQLYGTQSFGVTLDGVQTGKKNKQFIKIFFNGYVKIH